MKFSRNLINRTHSIERKRGGFIQIPKSLVIFNIHTAREFTKYHYNRERKIIRTEKNRFTQSTKTSVKTLNCTTKDGVGVACDLAERNETYPYARPTDSFP